MAASLFCEHKRIALQCPECSPKKVGYLDRADFATAWGTMRRRCKIEGSITDMHDGSKHKVLIVEYPTVTLQWPASRTARLTLRRDDVKLEWQRLMTTGFLDVPPSKTQAQRDTSLAASLLSLLPYVEKTAVSGTMRLVVVEEELPRPKK
ncbi:MAG: hypothetical protein HY556_05195 [Euryarchaeota archaeon]|nr:hypothetical protein [Euryarchaeota archaeon]